MSPPCYADMRALNEPYGDAGAKRESAELAPTMCASDVMATLDRHSRPPGWITPSSRSR